MRKGKKTLPLEGGGKRVGVKDLTGRAKRLKKYFTESKDLRCSDSVITGDSEN
jgi:hypothetical protein